MTVYISGAVTGLPDNNKWAFNNAHSAIRALNKHAMRFDRCYLKIINPLHIGVIMRCAFAGKEPQWADYMRACVKKLCEADCVFFLPDRARSEGASMEHYIAKKLNIPLAYNMGELKKIMGCQNEDA